MLKSKAIVLLTTKVRVPRTEVTNPAFSFDIKTVEGVGANVSRANRGSGLPGYFLNRIHTPPPH